MKPILINPGHGQRQLGKRSGYLGFDHELKEQIMREDKQKGPGWRLPEWWTNKQIAARVCHLLDEAGIYNVNILPDSQNYGQYLSARVAKGNALKGRLWVGIHSDALGDGSQFFNVNAHHVFYAYHKDIAKIFNKHMEYLFPKEENRGVVRNPSPQSPSRFHELHGTNCPAVITENFFYSSEIGCRLILDSLDLISVAHTNAIIEWSKM